MIYTCRLKQIIRWDEVVLVDFHLLWWIVVLSTASLGKVLLVKQARWRANSFFFWKRRNSNINREKANLSLLNVQYWCKVLETGSFLLIRAHMHTGLSKGRSDSLDSKWRGLVLSPRRFLCDLLWEYCKTGSRRGRKKIGWRSERRSDRNCPAQHFPSS